MFISSMPKKKSSSLCKWEQLCPYIPFEDMKVSCPQTVYKDTTVSLKPTGLIVDIATTSCSTVLLLLVSCNGQNVDPGYYLN